MKRLLLYLWDKAREYLGALFFIGLFILLTGGTPPETWVEARLEWLGRLGGQFDLAAIASRYWPAGLDGRVAPVALGVILMVGSVWRRLLARDRTPSRARIDMLPYRSRGSLFKGRGPVLRTLRANLRHHGWAAIYGIGGVGKTRTAVEYALAHQRHYTAFLWVTADSVNALRDGLSGLVNPLSLTERAATDQDVRLHAVLEWLANNSRWLLILDNLDNQAALAEAETRLAGISTGHVLITSRLTQYPPELPAIQLGLLPLVDAVRFLLQRTTARHRDDTDDAGAAHELAEQDLGRLALALEQAGAYITHHQCRLRDYQAVLRANRAQVMGWFNEAVMHYPRAIADTWQTSVIQLTEPGRHLLERLAFLAPDPVPDFLLKTAVPGAEAEDARAAFGDLAAYSLATRDAEGEAFVVHRLVQDVTRRGLEQAGTAQARLTEALGWVDAAFAGDPQNVRSWDRLDPLAPHVDAVAAHGDTAGIAEPTAHLMDRLATLLQAKGSYPRADSLFHRAVAIAEQHYGQSDAGLASYLNNLAQLLQDTNRLGEAEPLMCRALAIDEASLGKDHPNVARDLNNLATLLQATNRLAEAEPLLRRALAIDEASLGKDHPNVARDLNNLATLLQATNRLGEAEPLMRRALAIDEASLGKDHPEVARDLNNLALLLQDTNRLGEAEPLMRRALAIDEASLGKDHPTVATALNNLARLLQATNRLGEAEPLMRRALAIDEASLGKDHPNVASVLNNLATLLQATNRLGEAEPLMRRALAIGEASLGKDHPNVAIRLNNLALLLQATNRLGEAEPLMRRALAIDEASLGKDHPDVARDLNNLALLLQATNRLGEAEPLMRRALAIDVASFGKDHPNVAIDLNNLARLLHDTNRLGEAEPLMRRALAIFLTFQRDTGHTHPHRDVVTRNYAGLLAAMGKSQSDIAATIAALHREAGLDQG